MKNLEPNIDKIYFMIHPCCWAMSPNGPLVQDIESHVPVSSWHTSLLWEQEVNKKQKEFISNMGPREALVIYPIGNTSAMHDLIMHAEHTVGPRCVIQKAPFPQVPDPLYKMSKPILHFLDSDEFKGRNKFWEVVPSHLRNALISEFRETCASDGYDWNPAALRVVAGNRVIAQELANEFHAKDLVVDAASVRAEAFGEGFEQCAMTWKAMVSHYLGWKHPIENNFNLSVSGAPVLFDALFKERLSLDHHIRLFLWQKSYGLPLGFFARASAQLGDPHFEMAIPLDGPELEVWGYHQLLWPANNSPLQVHNNCLHVPVLSSIRKEERDIPLYIVGCDKSFEEFSKRLADAKILERKF